MTEIQPATDEEIADALKRPHGFFVDALIARIRAEQAKGEVDKLRNAVKDLYFAAYWHPDRACDEGTLWLNIREAAGIEPGQSSQILGADRCSAVEPLGWKQRGSPAFWTTPTPHGKRLRAFELIFRTDEEAISWVVKHHPDRLQEALKAWGLSK